MPDSLAFCQAWWQFTIAIFGKKRLRKLPIEKLAINQFFHQFERFQHVNCRKIKGFFFYFGNHKLQLRIPWQQSSTFTVHISVFFRMQWWDCKKFFVVAQFCKKKKWKGKKVPIPGVEPGAQPWKGWMLPLHHIGQSWNDIQN